MDFDGLASGPSSSAGSAGVSGLGFNSNVNTGGSSGADAGPSGGGSAGSSGSEPVNLLVNPGFESPPSRWSPVGSCVVAISTDAPHTGNFCLLTTGRTETWQGPGYDLRGALTRSETYRVTVWGRVASGEMILTLTYKHRCTDETGEATYSTLGSIRGSTEWKELSATLPVPDCELAESVVYVEGPDVGADFYIDDTRVVPEIL